jgi:hypothetical protein
MAADEIWLAVSVAWIQKLLPEVRVAPVSVAPGAKE